MNTEIVLKSVLGLLGVWFFLAYFWRDYRIDALRDELFCLRDNLFMYAAKGCISFENPAYAILRERLNVLIRYAHEFTLFRMLIALLTTKKGWLATSKQHPSIVQWEESVKELPKEIQTAMNEFNTSLAFVVVKHMVYRCFFLYLFVRPFTPFIKIVVRREVVNNPQVVSSVERLESNALEQDARRLGKATAVTA